MNVRAAPRSLLVAFLSAACSAGTQPFDAASTSSAATAVAAPVLSPTKGYSAFHPLEVMTFNWSAVPGAATYVLQAATDSSFPVLTRFQFDNIPNTTYSFATPNEGNYFARVFAVDATGAFSPASNVITFSVFYNNPLPPPPAPQSPLGNPTLTLPITLTWAHVLNPQPSGYEVQIATDSRFRNIEEDVPQLNGPTRTLLSLRPGTKFWRVRSAQGDSSPTTAAVTAWSSAGTFTVSNAPPTPVSVAPTNNPIDSGDGAWVAVQLTAAVSGNGATIALASSNPAALPVPATIAMPPNTAWTQFTVQAGQVATATPVTLSATLNGATASVQVTVLPPTLQSVTVSPSTISGGAQPTATVMLNGQAPAGGAVVSLSSDSPALSPPATVTVPQGSFSTWFALPTSAVAAATPARLTATWNGASAQALVTVVPSPLPSALSLSPTSTVGLGGSSFATVTIASPQSTDTTFLVTSSNPAVASVPNSMIVPAGVTNGGFSVFTTAVSVQTDVTISVSGGGATKTAVLTVLPSASAPPPPTPPPPGAAATLTVTAGGRGGERVSSNPAGISVAVGSTGSASFATGTSITLSATNSRDVIWSGACSSGGQKTKTCTFTLSANASVTANVQ